MNGKKTIAIIGNPNSGKTTLFNRLTGSNQHVGNWPGVTVDRKTGHVCHDGVGVDIVDLPGIYSLSPYTQEEIIAREYVLSDELDGILNIVDAANIERNLYLTLQLISLGLPMVVALGFMDDVRAQGVEIDVAELERRLGVPVVPISAKKRREYPQPARRTGARHASARAAADLSARRGRGDPPRIRPAAAAAAARMQPAVLCGQAARGR